MIFEMYICSNSNNNQGEKIFLPKTECFSIVTNKNFNKSDFLYARTQKNIETQILTFGSLDNRNQDGQETISMFRYFKSLLLTHCNLSGIDDHYKRSSNIDIT